MGHPVNVTRRATQSDVNTLTTESKVEIAHCQLDASYTVRLPVDKGQMGKYFNENTGVKEMESWVIFSPSI